MVNQLLVSQLVTIEEASILARKSKSAIYKWISQGKVQKFKVDGKTFLDSLEVLRAERDIWLEKKERMAHARAQKSQHATTDAHKSP